MTGHVLLDSAVLIYSIGGAHPYREPCRQLMEAIRRGTVDASTTALAIQEVMHQRARRTGDRVAAAAVARDLSTVLGVHDLRGSDARRAAALFADHAALDAADAWHAAVAIDRGVTTIVSPDPAFDAVPGLVRLDPGAAAAAVSSPPRPG